MKREKTAFVTFLKFPPEVLGLMLLFVAGLGLRLYRLAVPAMWIDEIGVLEAASQPAWQQAVAVAKGHIMGMPLHYLQTWAAAQLGLHNEWLRLPDALWGSLTILLGYRLAKFYVEKPAALITAALIATSPLLIRYSQELRFYAALYFFYLLLIFSALQALEKRGWLRWLAVTLIGMTGILFHIYTITALVFVYAALLTRPQWRSLRNLRSLLTVTILLLGFFGWAAVEFGSVPGYRTPLFALEKPLNFVLRGLGLAPIHSPRGATLLYYLLLVIGFAAGVAGALKARRTALLIPLLAGLALIAVILGMNWYRHYFVHSRQIYYLSYWVYLLAAAGLCSLFGRLARRLSFLQKNQTRFAVGGTILILALCSLPALLQYYHAERSITKSGYAPLLEHWQAGDWICVIPDFDAFVFQTYWKEALGPWLLSCDHKEIFQNPQVKFVIASEEMDFSPAFREIYRPPADTFYPKRIWMREK